MLRKELGLTEAKKAYDTGDCGACTVIMDGKPIVSCLMLAIEAQREKITTIEELTRVVMYGSMLTLTS